MKDFGKLPKHLQKKYIDIIEYLDTLEGGTPDTTARALYKKAGGKFYMSWLSIRDIDLHYKSSVRSL